MIESLDPERGHPARVVDKDGRRLRPCSARSGKGVGGAFLITRQLACERGRNSRIARRSDGDSPVGMPRAFARLQTRLRLRQAFNSPWSGTLDHPAIEGVGAAVDYLARFGRGATRKQTVHDAIAAISVYEDELGAPRECQHAPPSVP
jgi:hypothetical protein